MMKRFFRLAFFLFLMIAASLSWVRGELMQPQAEIDQQNATIRQGEDLLYRGNFKEIERVGSELIQTKARQPFSAWKIRHFADAITNPKNPKDAKDWEFVIEKWETWQKESGSARDAGQGLPELRPQRQGIGFRCQVAEGNWPKFEERVKKAEGILQEARKKDPKNPENYRNLLHCGIFQGWHRKKMDELLKESITVAPDYFDCHYNMAYYLMERWHGNEGDWQRYANSLPEMLGGDTGLIVYARLSENLYQHYQKDFFAEDRDDKISWKRMKAGFEALVKHYPDSSQILNSYACFAWRAGDLETAREKFLLLDKKGLLFELRWGGRQQLDAARKDLVVDR